MLKLTKNSIIQQFTTNAGGQDIVSAYGTIVEVPNENAILEEDRGIGNKYKVGKIYGNFNNTDRFKTDVGDVNQIAGTYFNTEEPEFPWAAGTAYAQGDRVYSDKKIYEAQGAGTSGTITPIHTAGVQK